MSTPLIPDTNGRRLEIIKKVIQDYKLRFPVSELASKTGHDKGNISPMLNGKKPISRNFFNKVLELFPYTGPMPESTTKDKSIPEIVFLRNRVKELEEDKKFLQSIINSRLFS